MIKLRLGTRSSPLAMAQAHEARARLCAAHGWDESAVELVSVLASGDRVTDRALAEIGGKALWTKELDQWLAEGRIDAAVHSMKDVETLRPSSLAIAAILPRADIRDVLLGATSVEALPQGAVVGTSAPRRAAQILHNRPDCRVVTFRGNVATRLGKLEAGEVQATLLAAAGLDRLGLDLGTRLDPQEWLPAPAQGAIGIECRAQNAEMRALLGAIDHAPSHAQIMAERALLAALGGNCHSPIAVLCTPSPGAAEQLDMRAALFSPDGRARIEDSARFACGEMDGPAALAARLLASAPADITEHFTGPA